MTILFPYFSSGWNIEKERYPLEEEVGIMKEEGAVLDIVEKMPEFPGGQSAMYQFLSNNLKYPAIAKEVGISGKVYVAFVVEKDGSLTDIKVLKGIGGGCDKEAIRVNQMLTSVIAILFLYSQAKHQSCAR